MFQVTISGTSKQIHGVFLVGPPILRIYQVRRELRIDLAHGSCNLVDGSIPWQGIHHSLTAYLLVATYGSLKQCWVLTCSVKITQTLHQKDPARISGLRATSNARLQPLIWISGFKRTQVLPFGENFIANGLVLLIHGHLKVFKVGFFPWCFWNPRSRKKLQSDVLTNAKTWHNQKYIYI